MIAVRLSLPIAEETEYTFRHALMRDAANQTLTDAARVAAHALAGEWLGDVGFGDALALAEHSRCSSGLGPLEGLRRTWADADA